MIHKLTIKQRHLLDYLRESPGPRTTKECADYLHVTTSSASNMLRKMREVDLVHRLPAPGNSYSWTFKSYEPRPPVIIYRDGPSPYSKYRKDKTKPTPPPVIELQSENLQAFLAKWAEIEWRPRIFKSARNLPVGLGRLYELAIDASYGDPVDQITLDEIRQSLSEFAKDLEQTLKIVNGVLNIPDLWKAEAIAVYLIKSHPDTYAPLVASLKKVNK